jgi:triacylglycerol lipase
VSRAQRLLLLAVALVVVGVTAVALAVRLVAPDDLGGVAARQDLPGPVLLVPGYGGGTAGLEVLAAELRAAGRTATVVPLPDDGTGDLRDAAAAVDAAADAALATSTVGSVDVVGYSAGGVVARLWAQDSADRVRRVVTLGSPHHGTSVAALGAALAPERCPVACQQLVPGSPLLEELNGEDETPDGPQWLALWTEQDEVVTPPESARLEGAVNVELQDLCPGVRVGHGELPTAPLVRALVLDALSAGPLSSPPATACTAVHS